MRAVRIAGLLLAAGFAVTGCAQLEHPTAIPQPSPSIPAGEGEFGQAPSPSPQPTPAAKAGGTCTLVDYAGAQQATGTQFQVAAASDANGASSCALQVLYSDYPDLVLAVADTDADAKAFGKAEPNGATKVSNLGSAAYSEVLSPSGSAGPVIEIVWLGRHSQIVTLRYTYPRTISTNTAQSAVPDLITYARQIEDKR